jgi:aspartyl-tRNA(Asn)/glutamyl-tRNA(Gln) amidotransferase subunit A
MKFNMTAAAIAKAVGSGEMAAVDVVKQSLARIAKHNERLGAFTDVVADRAMTRAAAVDKQVAGGGKPPPLAGVPFAAKNLYDIEGLVTRAGSKINRANGPAGKDATLVQRLEAAGAVLVGATNMDEYAYGFVGENAHDGPSRNPHNLEHMTGGSSAGSASAVASGLVALALGSDTNGSIRVPASFCGLFGLKPTYGRLSRARTYPFVASCDTLGPLGRSARDLALAYDAMQGFDDSDPAQTKRPMEPTEARLKHPIPGVRIAIAAGYFAGDAEAQAHVAHVSRALDAARVLTIPEAAAARAAAALITMAEGAALHLDRLREQPEDYDPEVRDRLLAGTMLPAAWIVKAQKLRREFREKVLTLFEEVDAILAPATPMHAPKIGQKMAMFGGVEMPVRPNIGIFTQPFSFIGLPAVSVPVWLPNATLPMGVQVVAPPWREDICLRIAHHLEQSGACAAPVGKEFVEE